jgi:hypothetical protein
MSENEKNFPEQQDLNDEQAASGIAEAAKDVAIERAEEEATVDAATSEKRKLSLPVFRLRPLRRDRCG